MSPRSNRKPILCQRSFWIKHVTSMSYKLEPAIRSHDTGQRIAWFDRCQLIITWCHISKKYTVNQGCMSLSTYYLEYGRHLARLHRRRRRRAYAPMSNTASRDNHEKINSWVSFSFLYGYGAPLGGPLGRRSSANINISAYWTCTSWNKKMFEQSVLDIYVLYLKFEYGSILYRFRSP